MAWSQEDEEYLRALEEADGADLATRGAPMAQQVAPAAAAPMQTVASPAPMAPSPPMTGVERTMGDRLMDFGSGIVSGVTKIRRGIEGALAPDAGGEGATFGPGGASRDVNRAGKNALRAAGRLAYGIPSFIADTGARMAAYTFGPKEYERVDPDGETSIGVRESGAADVGERLVSGALVDAPRAAANLVVEPVAKFAADLNTLGVEETFARNPLAPIEEVAVPLMGLKGPLVGRTKTGALAPGPVTRIAAGAVRAPFAAMAAAPGALARQMPTFTGMARETFPTVDRMVNPPPPAPLRGTVADVPWEATDGPIVPRTAEASRAALASQGGGVKQRLALNRRRDMQAAAKAGQRFNPRRPQADPDLAQAADAQSRQFEEAKARAEGTEGAYNEAQRAARDFAVEEEGGQIRRRVEQEMAAEQEAGQIAREQGAMLEREIARRPPAPEPEGPPPGVGRAYERAYDPGYETDVLPTRPIAEPPPRAPEVRIAEIEAELADLKAQVQPQAAPAPEPLLKPAPQPEAAPPPKPKATLPFGKAPARPGRQKAPSPDLEAGRRFAEQLWENPDAEPPPQTSDQFWEGASQRLQELSPEAQPSLPVKPKRRAKAERPK